MSASRTEPRVAAALTTLGAALLLYSYTLPTVTFRTLGAAEPEVYSIWGGIVSLWHDGNVLLAPIVFLFSIVFPVAKLLALGAILVSGRPLVRTVTWLRLLGKWSMLDVWIVGLFVGSIRIGIATASSRPGILVFALAIVVSVFAATASERVVLARSARSTRRAAEDEREASPAARSAAAVPDTAAQRRRRMWGRLTSACAAASLGGAVFLPLFIVTKGFFFSNEVALWATATGLARADERALGFGLLALVAVVPAARTLVSGLYWWRPQAQLALARAAARLDEWALIEVFALAVAIVHVKLAELATAHLRLGFWCVYAAALFALVDAWLVRRAAGEAERGEFTGAA